LSNTLANKFNKPNFKNRIFIEYFRVKIFILNNCPKIKKITGRDNVRQFLAKLGFVEGESVTVISEISGNMIINVKDSRIAIGKSMANRIII